MTKDLEKLLKELPAISLSENHESMVRGGATGSPAQPMDLAYCVTHINCTDTNPSICPSDKSCPTHSYCVIFSKCGNNPTNNAWDIEVCGKP